MSEWFAKAARLQIEVSVLVSPLHLLSFQHSQVFVSLHLELCAHRTPIWFPSSALRLELGQRKRLPVHIWENFAQAMTFEP